MFPLILNGAELLIRMDREKEVLGKDDSMHCVKYRGNVIDCEVPTINR